MPPRKKTAKQRKINDLKSEKLQAFLDDFDCEVKTVIERLKERKNQLIKDADNSYNMHLIKLPMAVRKMNWLEHCKLDKPKTPPADNSKKAEAAAEVESVLAEVQTIPKTVKKSSKEGLVKTTSEDEENIAPKTTKKKGRPPGKKPPTTTKRAKATSTAKLNSSTRKSNKKPLFTPARTLLDCSMMGPTPLVTPRFDPRLPKTPAVRVPRHKERVYSISVNGSPIAGGSQELIINVPTGNGESLQLLASQMDSIDLQQLDETALQSIRQLQNRLASLCGPSV